MTFWLNDVLICKKLVNRFFCDLQDGLCLRAGTARKSSEWVKIAFFMLICANLTINFCFIHKLHDSTHKG